METYIQIYTYVNYKYFREFSNKLNERSCTILQTVCLWSIWYTHYSWIIHFASVHFAIKFPLSACNVHITYYIKVIKECHLHIKDVRWDTSTKQICQFGQWINMAVLFDRNKIFDNYIHFIIKHVRCSKTIDVTPTIYENFDFVLKYCTILLHFLLRLLCNSSVARQISHCNDQHPTYMHIVSKKCFYNT